MELDLGELYTTLASYKGLPFPIGIKKLPAYKIKQFKDRFGFAVEEGGVPDIYGKLMIMPARIGETYLGSGLKGDHLTIQPMITIEGTKHIVKNIIGGGSYNGTVKEFINFGDYNISIVGAIVNPNQKEYPYEQAKILKEKLWLPNEAQEFHSALTEDLFTHIVVTKIKFNELSKSPGIQMYEIEALSDGITEVEQLNGK